ncbi:MAG: hypothetical protein LBQ44_02875, partial [Treponema sp.]|nr:hypothetical protein [Treponema sp.]
MIWITLHAGVFLALALSVLTGLFIPKIDTDLLNLMPKSPSKHAPADRLLEERNVRSFFILSADPDFSRAREGAEGLFLNLTGLDLFEELSLYA